MLNASSKRMILQDVCWGCSGSKQPCLVFHLLPSCAVPKDPRSLLFLAGACAWFFVFFFSPPFSLESSQIKMAVIQSQESLPLLWK